MNTLLQYLLITALLLTALVYGSHWYRERLVTQTAATTVSVREARQGGFIKP